MQILYDRRSLLGVLVAGSSANAYASNKSELQSCADSRFAKSLLAVGPHASLGPHADTYGRLVGHWAGSYQDMEDGAVVDSGTIEAHFAWVLEGRAIQDIWISPARSSSPASMGKRQTYGTTFPVFDASLEGWRCTWITSHADARKELVGRRVDNDIVQYSVNQERPEQWVFSEICTNSFVWRGSILADNGKSWNLGTEFRLLRSFG